MRLTPLLLAFAAFAQFPTFNVASVKPSPTDKGDRIQINLGSFRNGVVALTNTTPLSLIHISLQSQRSEGDQKPGILPERYRQNHLRL